jgi:hypothetical protein
MQKARRHPTCGLRPLVGVRFQVLFHPSILSVGQEYLALEDGPPIFRQDFTCPALLIYHSNMPFMYGAITLYGCSFQNILLNI